MAKEICISSTPHETRLAILEDDQLAEIYYERENEYTLAGSIYNGRVTRVLPGMQSAFVDLGLERDAFLYVTDFMELEDAEETDELEQAAASGANQPPREIRRQNGAPRGQKQEQRQDRQPREAQPVEEAETAAPPAVEIIPAVNDAEDRDDDQQSSGGRRWRGRRHRRGARGQTDQRETHAEPEAKQESSFSANTFEESAEPETSYEIRATEVPAARQPASTPEPAPRAPRAVATSTPILLPGESLSKYGGTPVAEEPKAAPAPPSRSLSYQKPSTLIEAPLEWDGSGLLPGESLSLRKSRQTEPAAEPVETVEQTEAAPAATQEEAAPAKAPEYEYVEETEEVELEKRAEEPEFEASQLEEETIEVEAAEELNAEPAAPAAETAEPEAEASASHRVDPLPPSSFRLFGFGKKDKKDEEAAAPKSVQSSVAVASSYKPGAGLIEEEVIEGEEFETVSHQRHHKAAEHDTDDYEEETLRTGRSGELGEMLQEAHLDHKIQLNFDEKGVEEDVLDEDDEEEEGAAAQPTNGDAASQPRRERGGRGRRGRGAPPARGDQRRSGPSRRSMQTTDLPVISDLLKPGQEILVQIAKEPIAKKGARITSHIALPGRFLVFMPTVTHIGVSRKIASDEERHRLKRILMHERGEASGGFIVRTAAEGASEEDLRADLRFLMNLWNDVKQRSESSKSPALIYHDLSLIERILRDQVSSNFSNIWVDSEADYERIVRFLNRFSPTLVRRVKLYTKETPLFEHFGIQDEISKALRSKVWLKSGGSIVINQTEALVAIDINTGKYVGKSARLEDTIVKTNLDAVPEIVRQIRLRDLGGIIVIDFIDMDERKNRFKVLAALEEALKADRAPTKVLQFNDFGLVAITRKRVKKSLERTLSVPCPTCQATGMVKSPTTVCNEIYVELRKMKKHFEGADVMLRVNPETVKVLKSNNASWLQEFEELTGKNILVKSDAALHPEQFDIQG